jgi:hypothetical protein
MDAVTKSILTEHLPYELDMFEAAFVFLHSNEFAEARKVVFLKNAAIESFWLHARNLIEFLTHSESDGRSGLVSARDFTTGFYPNTIMREIDQRINAGVSHLLYERKTRTEDKLAWHDMLRVKQHVDREINSFEATLLPAYRAVWVPRVPSDWIEVGSLMSSTNSTTSVTTMLAGWTGPTQTR